MSAHDYPDVMSGKLHLDPFVPTPGEPAPAAEPDITMGVTTERHHGIGTGGLPPSLDPAVMGPVFGHYGDGDDLEKQLEKRLTLASNFLDRDRGNPAAPGWGLNDAGPGYTTKNWQIGGKPKMSTDDTYDTPDTRDRATRTDADKTEAQKRGETAPNPVKDAVSPPE
jgi:hypothetical protein